MQNKSQLFCFTYAGGSSAFFNVITDDLKDIDVIAFEYAGHGARYKEEFYSDFDELADDLFDRFKAAYRGEEYALFGYSMGSISLVEVLKRIIASQIRKPVCIFLAAHEPHTKSELLDFSSDETDEWVKDRTVKFGGVPEKLLKNGAFWRTYLPVYRADYTIIGKYSFEKLQIKTDIPAIVFYSEKDTPISDMKLWDRYFNCDFYEFEGTHFFIQEHHNAIAKIIRQNMVKGYEI